MQSCLGVLWTTMPCAIFSPPPRPRPPPILTGGCVFIDLRERKGEIETPVRCLAGDQTRSLGVCPPREWYLQSLGYEAMLQPPEPPGQGAVVYCYLQWRTLTPILGGCGHWMQEPVNRVEESLPAMEVARQGTCDGRGSGDVRVWVTSHHPVHSVHEPLSCLMLTHGDLTSLRRTSGKGGVWLHAPQPATPPPTTHPGNSAQRGGRRGEAAGGAAAAKAANRRLSPGTGAPPPESPLRMPSRVAPLLPAQRRPRGAKGADSSLGF